MKLLVLLLVAVGAYLAAYVAFVARPVRVWVDPLDVPWGHVVG